MTIPPYRDPSVAIEDRVENLLSLMTIDEKLAQLGCLWSTSFIHQGAFDPELVAQQMPHGIGQVTRIGASTGLHPQESATFMNAIQKVALERTRLGIPIMVHEEATGGFCHRDATVFPQGIGLASTWDPELVQQVADTIRVQMRAVGARHALAPVLDVARDPRWGRVEETYGEDPVLISTLGTAYVRGLQSDDLSQGVAATGKHFLGYAMSDGARNWGPVQLGPRELREVYAEPFCRVIQDAHLATIMNSYTSLDGIPCAGSPAILTELLREELGFTGAVVADYDAVIQLMKYHRVAATPGEAARLALQAGLDLELPSVDCFGAPLKEEITTGRLPLTVIDTAVRRILALKFKLGLFEYPYVESSQAAEVFQTPAQRALARQVVQEATIVLTNDGILPLAPTLKRIAVIGPGANDQRLLQGDYHYPAHQEIIFDIPEEMRVAGLALPQADGPYAPGPYFTPHVTPLAGLRAALPAEVEITYAKGCEVLGDERSGFAEAKRLAQQAEVAIVVVAGKSGLRRPVTVGEGNDATHLDLTGVQEELLAEIAQCGVPLVVVVLSGRVHTLTNIAAHANALLQLFPAGEEGGNGLADILTGKVNPSGRLPITFPRSVGQVPIHSGHRAGGDRALLFGDYVDSPTTPLFAFGHGLSYTTFAYQNLTIETGKTDQEIRVTVDVQNVGDRAGAEVVQLYSSDCVASVARPDRQLLGFTRLTLAPGETRQVVFTIHLSRLAFFNAQMRFVVEPGAFTLSIGASSVDIRAEQTIILDGEVREYLQREVQPTRIAVGETSKLSGVMVR